MEINPNYRFEKKSKEYKQPKVEVLEFSYEDVISTSSGCTNVGCIGRMDFGF